MRILYVEKKTNLSGQVVRTLGDIWGLKRRGHEVTLACQPDGVIGPRAQEAGARVITLPMSGMKLYSSALNLRRRIRSGGFQLVHTSGPRSNLLGALALLGVRGVALVYTKHNMVPLRNGPFSRALYAHFTTHIVAVCNAVRDMLIDNGIPAQNISVICNSVDPVRFSPRPKDEKLLKELCLSAEDIVVGMAGRLGSSSVDAPTLLRAFQKLRPRYSHLRLLMVGRGSEATAKLAAELGVADGVVLPGFTDDMPAMLSLVDLFVQPNARSALSTALLQAMAAARPVVATRVGGNLEAVDDGSTGRLCPPGDPEAMAGTIAEMIERPAEMEEMGQRGRDRALELFSPERMAQQLEAIYAKVINAHTRCGKD